MRHSDIESFERDTFPHAFRYEYVPVSLLRLSIHALASSKAVAQVRGVVTVWGVDTRNKAGLVI